jgi:hypothetical protein
MTTADPAPKPPCRCPACTAKAALVLLETGRAGMAARLLEGLPEALRQAVQDAYAAGRAEGMAECQRQAAPRPRKRGRP